MNAKPKLAAVGPAIALALDDPTLGGKFLGTTHMMMLGTNNLEVFRSAPEVCGRKHTQSDPFKLLVHLDCLR